MNTRRSYLDTLNAGRQRRPNPSFDDLDRTLADLEGRLQRSREAFVPSRADAYAQPATGTYGQPAARPDLRTLARDLETTRRQEDGLNGIGKIAAELKAMREELRLQMSQGLQREFDALRQDIQRLHVAAPAINGAELAAEFERLSDAVRSLAERSDDKSVNMLRLELEQVKHSLDSLAREETVRSVGRRWDEFDRRWSKLESRIDAPGRDLRPNLDALNRQLEEISQSVNRLPESLSVRSLEERIRTLAGSVEQFARQYGTTMPDAFALIEQRLDEISRAIAASAPMAQTVSFDHEPFERIEARVNSLARQIDELLEEQSSGEIIERLNRLSQRVDEIAQRVDVPETVVARLADQIAIISDHLAGDSGAAQANALFQGLEERFVRLSQVLERRQEDAVEQGHELFRELERRLDDFARRVERQGPAELDQRGILETIENRFAELAARLENSTIATEGTRSLELEQRLEDISHRLEQSARMAAGIDPDVIRNLESQVAALSEHLSRPSNPLPEFDDLAPRLEHLEQSLAGGREAILEAARRAAQDAVAAMAQNQSDAAAVASLAAELKSLDQLARRSDERNAKTFEAIHDTLLKIVDRLGTLEHGTAPQPDKMHIGAAPLLDDDEDEFARADFGRGSAVSAHTRSPAEAAAAAAKDALNKDQAAEGPETGNGKVSMLSGLARAFRKEREPAAEPARPNVADDPSFEEPIDAKLANQPLEPGSGAPDLNAIIRRVREQNGTQSAGTSETAKSDFIAAARRAAQAAAAEAQTTKLSGEKASVGGKLKIGEMFKARRKTVLLGATALMVVLAGWQLSNAFRPGDFGPVAEATLETPADQPALKAEAMPEVAAPAPRIAEEATATPPVRVAAEAAPAPERTSAVPDVQPERETAEAEAPAPILDEPTAGTSEPGPVFAESAATDAESANGASEEQPARMAALATDPVESLPASYTPAPAEIGNEALREAADSGNPKAMFEIATRYADGRGVNNDMVAAAEWYGRAAELGYAPAQYRLGNFYEKGLGTDRDIAKAKEWYEKAAKQGNASAMHNLAVLYAMGADGKVDNDAAARWFLEAAELGVKDSQYNLGILAAKGAGMPQSLEESYKWFALVAKTGDKDAEAKRDEVAKALRPEQLVKAKQAAELWKARPVDPEANIVEIPEEWSDAPRTANLDVKQAITNIQSILNKNGYDAGPADGVLGQKTRNAIKAFQADNGMEADGEISEKLVKALLARK